MDKKTFIKLITELVAIKKSEEALNKAFRDFEPDFNYISFGRYETLVVQSLEEAMSDKDRWISHWIYELDCGKDAKKFPVTFKKKKVPMETPEDLYNCIMYKTN